MELTYRESCQKKISMHACKKSKKKAINSLTTRYTVEMGFAPFFMNYIQFCLDFDTIDLLRNDVLKIIIYVLSFFFNHPIYIECFSCFLFCLLHFPFYYFFLPSALYFFFLRSSHFYVLPFFLLSFISCLLHYFCFFSPPSLLSTLTPFLTFIFLPLPHFYFLLSSFLFFVSSFLTFLFLFPSLTSFNYFPLPHFIYLFIPSSMFFSSFFTPSTHLHLEFI